MGLKGDNLSISFMLQGKIKRFDIETALVHYKSEGKRIQHQAVVIIVVLCTMYECEHATFHKQIF